MAKAEGSQSYIPWHCLVVVVVLVALNCVASWRSVQQYAPSFASIARVETQYTQNTSVIRRHNDYEEEVVAMSGNNTNTQLPEALEPVTFERCCDNATASWKSTCFTEAACNDPIYPFSSPAEASMFERFKRTATEKVLHRRNCKEANSRLTPPTKWCQEKSDNVDLNFFPAGCSTYSMAGGSGPFDRMILFPQGKLAFCGIPKAGITQWIQFLRFTMGAKDYQSFPHFKRDVQRLRFDKVNPKLQEQIWNDPLWTKAILIRDPAERFLSAYLDKVENNNRLFGRYNVTFAEFVDFVSMETGTATTPKNAGLSWYTDPHWRPQAWSCGLSDAMPNFQYVGILDRDGNSTRALLEKVGMWETFGKHYRTNEKPQNEPTSARRPAPLIPGEMMTGFQQQKAGMDTHGHNKNSHDKLNKYYTPELMEKVKRAYWMDFALWGALQESNDKGTVHGKDIASKLNPECSTVAK